MINAGVDERNKRDLEQEESEKVTDEVVSQKLKAKVELYSKMGMCNRTKCVWRFIYFAANLLSIILYRSKLS